MDIKLLKFDIKGDHRGSLVALESFKNIPFDIKRVYYLFGTKEGVKRGFMHTKKLKQVAVCVSGSCKFLLDNGREKTTIELSSPDIGLFMGEMIWREMFDFTPDCVVLVLADDYYDEGDYIRDYERFVGEVKKC